MAMTFKTLNPVTGQYGVPTSWNKLYIDDMQFKVEGFDDLEDEYGDSVDVNSNYPISVSLSVNETGGAILLTRKFYLGLSLDSFLLDLRNDIRQNLSLSAISGDSFLEPKSSLSLKLTVTAKIRPANEQDGDTLSADQTFIVRLGKGGTTLSPLTDINYLDIDEDTQMRLAIRNMQTSNGAQVTDTISISVLSQRGVQSAGNQAFTGYLSQPLLFGKKAASSLPLRYDEPFRLIYGAVNSSYTPVPSPIYCLRRGSAEKFMFLNKYGAWDVIPMFGTLKRTPEYTLESVATASGRVQTRAEKEEAYTQNSGNLTEESFIALGDNLLSSQIYHWSGGAWHQITIEETDFSFSKTDELHSCTFRFRYCETDYTPSV